MNSSHEKIYFSSTDFYDRFHGKQNIFYSATKYINYDEKDRDKSLAESSSYVLLLFHSLKIRHSFSSFKHEKTEIE